MGMIEWAKEEVKIACETERGNNSESDETFFNYSSLCYKSALKAFESLCNDGHSGFSIKLTGSILIRLLEGQPLTPIEDTDDSWNVCNSTDGEVLYQSKRMSSLFKTVYADGTIKYNDNNRICCIDINDVGITHHSLMVSRILNEMFPITMPYMPGKPIKVYCEDFLVDEKNGDFDTVGIFYALKTKYGIQERIEINRFFKELENGEGEYVEISKEEYEERKRVKLK